jgi:hypothetical protein
MKLINKDCFKQPCLLYAYKMKVNIEFRRLKMHKIAIAKLCRPRELLAKKLALLGNTLTR